MAEYKDKSNKKAAKRVGGLTYYAEKKVLIWMAKRLHPFFTPNRLTILTLIAAFLVGFSYYLTNQSKFWLIAASLFLVLHWWADSLDGTIARVRKITRERFGYYVDHIMDSIGIFFIVFGMGLSPSLQMPIALSLIIMYYLLCINSYLMAYTQGKFNLAYGRIGPTEVRILIILFNTILLFFPYPLDFFTIENITFTLFDFFGIIMLCVFVCGFFLGVAENLMYLNRVDKKTYKEMSFKEALQRNQFIDSLRESYGFIQESFSRKR